MSPTGDNYQPQKAQKAQIKRRFEFDLQISFLFVPFVLFVA